MKYALITLGLASILLAGCNDEGITPTGKACLGTDHDSIVETLNGQCEKGDIIATKNPGYFCDFKSTVVMNSFNSAVCIYTGKIADERIEAKEQPNSNQ